MKQTFQNILKGQKKDGSQSQLFILTIVIFSAFSILKPHVFFTLLNIKSMGFQIPEIAILGMAVMLSMITGGIDLSIVSIANITGLTTAFMITQHPASTGMSLNLWIAFSMFIGLLLGLLCGVVNGFLIATVNVAPILATLGTNTLFNGLAVGIRNGESISGLPKQYVRIGNGTFLGIPMPLILLLIISILVGIYLNRTGLGLKTYLVGANRSLARYSGIEDKRILRITYLGSAFLAAIAGLIISARVASASPDYGADYVLLSIVIVVLGGVSPTGGFGKVTGVIMATSILQIILTGFNDLSFSQFFYLICQGLVLITVIGLNISRSKNPQKISTYFRLRRN